MTGIDQFDEAICKYLECRRLHNSYECPDCSCDECEYNLPDRVYEAIEEIEVYYR